MIPRPTRRAVVDVGRKCNVKCKQCYYAQSPSDSWNSPEQLKVEIAEAKRRGNNYIDFTGGEPSIYPAMPEILRYCSGQQLKCCIITNGIAGEVATNNIIEAGIDDWLVSVHGTAEIHDAIVQLPGARKMQERFLSQIADQGDFRFNCTIIRDNQADLLGLAKWAAQYKPRIFNFINFNPHHAWKNDPRTKLICADLELVENQLNESIAILQDAGAGVNVRYYPMCRITEKYRPCVCNDLQVLFDPYEWDYSIAPKTYKSYYNAAVNLSNQNEWKGQPCQSCDLRFICGGINSVFYRESGMKCVTPVSAPDVPRDDNYHYRRQNIKCLTDRIPRTDMVCVAAIADEAMRMYVPLFLYCAQKAYPDFDVRVFARYTGHDELRSMIDPVVGYGFYDSCVVPVDMALAEFSHDASITRALRFTEFEKDLKEYAHVLWTDIDILLYPDGDIIRAHMDQMKKDGTVVYENWLTVHENKRRLCGVHFVTRDWWERTRSARAEIREQLKNLSSAAWDHDEDMLRDIVEKSGLPLSPREQRLWRHHGLHIGDCRYAKRNNTPLKLSDYATKRLQEYLTDKAFLFVAKQSGDKCDDIARAMVLWNLSDKIKPGAADIVKKQPQKTGKKNMKYNPVHYDKGKARIFTMCDNAYAWYAPLFLYSLKMSYPEYDALIVVNGEEDKELLKLCAPFGASIRHETILSDVKHAGWTTAALRFVYPEDICSGYEWVLITDIDMLIYKETMNIVDQHMMHLVTDGTEVYENWISQYHGSNPRCPGVHFAKKEWFDRTKEAQATELDALKTMGGADVYCYDELLIGRIIQKCGLRLPPQNAKLWRHHGVHIGDWRLNIARKTLPFPNVWEKMHIKKLLEDSLFIQMAKECGKRIPLILECLKKWPILFK